MIAYFRVVKIWSTNVCGTLKDNFYLTRLTEVETKYFWIHQT